MTGATIREQLIAVENRVLALFNALESRSLSAPDLGITRNLVSTHRTAIQDLQLRDRIVDDESEELEYLDEWASSVRASMLHTNKQIDEIQKEQDSTGGVVDLSLTRSLLTILDADSAELDHITQRLSEIGIQGLIDAWTREEDELRKALKTSDEELRFNSLLSFSETSGLIKGEC